MENHELKNSIYLSICIPTYNRSEYLKKTLDSIVGQKRFQLGGDIEIVISDNCSTDNTEDVARDYIAIWGDRIRYHRNIENIKDRNFEKVLSLGKGQYLKLNNDTLMHNENSICELVDVINENRGQNSLIFFLNGAFNLRSKCKKCNDLNDFIKTVSIYSTWIAGFGIWKEQFDKIQDFSRRSDIQLVQTDVLFRLISSNTKCVVYNGVLFNPVAPSKKGGYNNYRVFIQYYLGLLKDCYKDNKISIFTYEFEKYRLFRYQILPFTYNAVICKKSEFEFDVSNGFEIFIKKYWYEPYVLLGGAYFLVKILTDFQFKK